MAIDEFAKGYLHDNLRWAREDLLGKLEGLSEYDVRRPLSRTGTNLLGLVKHLTISAAHYLGSIMGRPGPESIARFDAPDFVNRDSLWVTVDESSAQVLEGYAAACRHADATIESLPIDAPGFVPWWPRPNVKLFNVMVHVLTETNRHLGHADLVREEIDGALGSDPTPSTAEDDAAWSAHRDRLEQAAQAHL